MTFDRELDESANPVAARTNLERFLEQGGIVPEDSAARRILATLFGGSPSLSETLIQEPQLLDWLVDPGTFHSTRTAEAFHAAARAAQAGAGLAGIHRFHRNEILRIGARDLRGAGTTTEIINEISWLADAVIQCAFDIAWEELSERLGTPNGGFAVIGVGKLGGEELNFSSDVDIFYVYSDSRDEEFCLKLARRITGILSEHTSEGTFYRVDLRLRPEGSDGPLAASFPMLENYYVSGAETFERLALIKARRVAGDADVGEDFLLMIKSFVYRKYLDFDVIDEIRDIKLRIDREVERSTGLDRDVKRGRGGIREIEFFAQVLQVLYGGEREELRNRSTLAALELLSAAGLIEFSVAAGLRDAYIFLRDVEHKLQIVNQAQTHQLPEEHEELMRCANRMRMPFDEFKLALRTNRDMVHATFGDLFSTKARVEDGIAGVVHRFVNLDLDTEATRNWLASLGFTEPVQSAHNLEVLRDAPGFSHSPARMRKLLASVLTPLLESATRLPHRDTVVNRFETLTSYVGAREAFFMALLENPRSISRLVHLLAFSEYLSEILFALPELLDFLVDESRFDRPLQYPTPAADRRIQEFYIGVQYLFGVLSRRRACRLLTRFAEREVLESFPSSPTLALIALGKMGERELNFRSDLDVIAFYDGEFEPARKAIEVFVRALSERFKVDLRLRPDGEDGVLVWNPARYEEYLRTRGQTWERMALTKARFVAGDMRLGNRIIGIIHEFVYERPFGAKEIDEMNAIRRRMEVELGREDRGGAGAWNLKVGRGGIVDIEFLVEYCQIEHNIRIPNTIAAMKRSGLAPELRDAYEFLRNAESMLRLSSNLTASRIEARHLAGLGEMMHVPDFAREYVRVTDEVRRLFERRSGGARTTGPGANS